MSSKLFSIQKVIIGHSCSPSVGNEFENMLWKNKIFSIAYRMCIRIGRCSRDLMHCKRSIKCTANIY